MGDDPKIGKEGEYTDKIYLNRWTLITSPVPSKVEV